MIYRWSLPLMHASGFRSPVTSLTLILLLIGSCLANTKLEQEYQTQQGKLQRESKAVKKVKILIKMSKINLKLAGQSVKNRRYSDADRLLGRYVTTIKHAGQILKASKRNPQRQPAGFKHLEIALRRQLRQLADLADSYPFNQKDTINQAQECAALVKSKMITALFGLDKNTQPSNDSLDSSGPKHP